MQSLYRKYSRGYTNTIMAPEVKKLKNGITAIVEDRPHSKTVTVLTSVCVGADYELKGEHGLAHFFEHMCFKGTKRYPNYRDLLLAIDSLGLASNAFTGRDRTAYHFRGLPQDLEEIISLNAEMFLDNILPEKELEKERKVIIEEIKMYDDKSTSVLGKLVRECIYKGTPGEFSILGTIDDIKGHSYESFLNFREKHYVSGNTVVIVVGNTDGMDVFSLLEKHFSGVKQGGRSTREKIEFSYTTPRVTIKNIKKFDTTVFDFAFDAMPLIRSKESAALDMLESVLCDGMSSRIFDRIREQMAACYSVDFSSSGSLEYASSSVYSSIDGVRLNEVLTALVEELNKIKDKQVPTKELDRAKKVSLSSYARSLESDFRRMYSYLSCFSNNDPMFDLDEWLSLIKDVRAEDIQKVAVDMFTKEKAKLVVVGPNAHDVEALSGVVDRLG